MKKYFKFVNEKFGNLFLITNYYSLVQLQFQKNSKKIENKGVLCAILLIYKKKQVFFSSYPKTTNNIITKLYFTVEKQAK
jgi:hypothetical protein